MRKEKNIYNQQITARLTNDLVSRVDAICEEKMLARGSVIRNWIQRAVRDEERVDNSMQSQNEPTFSLPSK